MLCLPTGSFVSQQDVHHLCWLIAGKSKEHKNFAGAVSGIICKHVVPFLEFRIDKRCHLAAGCDTTCAVQGDGMLKCFGSNECGQCDVPADLGPVVAVAAGWHHTCAVQSDGMLKCFGGNEFGQCDVPADLGPVVAVAAGRYHTCAVQSDGMLKCFGLIMGSRSFTINVGAPQAGHLRALREQALRIGVTYVPMLISCYGRWHADNAGSEATGSRGPQGLPPSAVIRQSVL